MNEMHMTVQAIADLLGGDVEGDGGVEITALAPVEVAGSGEVTFAVDARRVAALSGSVAGAAIVSRDTGPAAMPLIRVDNVNAAVAALLGALAPAEDLPAPGVHPTACIDESASLGTEVAVGPGVVVGPRARIGPRSVLCANVSVGADVTIGPDVVLFDGVVVRHGCVVGDRSRIGPNSVIGFEGFGYYYADGAHHRIPHAGNVIIAEDVDIGACACIDRGKLDATRIGAGTKIDNLVQIGHSVQVGRACLMAGQVGVGGSSRLGDGVVLGGHAGVRDNITIGAGAGCAAFAAISKDVPPGQNVAGIPATPIRQAYQIMVAKSRLPELIKRVRSLEVRLKALESSEDNP